MITFFIESFIVIIFIYYVTVVLHLLGIPIFKKAEISVLLALIPFYYWVKRDVTV
jgi:hypothetical protein